MTHVFISYVRENRTVVDKLATALGQSGVKVWLDRNNIHPGQRWQDAIANAIKSGDFFIACFSKESNAKQRSYMNEELTIAIDQLRLMSTRAWFIPVILDTTEMPSRRISATETLNDIQGVFLSEDWDLGISRILKVLCREDPMANRVWGLVDSLSLPNVAHRRDAAAQLATIGRPARLAVPALGIALTDPVWKIRKIAAEALGNIGPASKPVALGLIKALGDPNAEVQLEARNALSRIGSIPANARAGLISAAVSVLSRYSRNVKSHMGDSPEDRQWAKWAADALGALGKEAAVAVATLTVVSGKRHYNDVRSAAVHALGRMGAAAVAGVSQLARVVEDRSMYNSDVRSAAIQALGRLGPHAVGAVPSLLTVFGGHESKAIVAAVLHCLAKIGPRAAQAVPRVIGCLDDPDVSDAAAATLPKLGLPPASVAPELIALLGCGGSVQDAADKVLAAIGTPPSSVVPKLIGLLGRYSKDQVRGTAAAMLDKIGTPPASSTPELIELLGWGETIRDAAAAALEKIGAPPASGAPDLVELLGSPRETVRNVAAEVLTRLGTPPASAAPRLILALGSRDERICQAAETALKRMRKSRSSFLPILIKALNDPKAFGSSRNVVIRRAARVLGSMGPSAARAIPVLMSILDERIDANYRSEREEITGELIMAVNKLQGHAPSDSTYQVAVRRRRSRR